MNDYQLSAPAINQLKRQHRQAKTKFEADRLKALYLLGEGWEPKTVAHVLDKDIRTILSYFQHYKDGGSDQLLQNKYPLSVLELCLFDFLEVFGQSGA